LAKTGGPRLKKIYLMAFIVAIIAGLTTYYFAASIQRQAQKSTDNKQYVVVAAVSIPADTIITAEMVQSIELPSEAIHANAVKSLTDAIGKINQYPVAPQEQILSSRIQEKSKDNKRLSYSLEPGYRAITLSVDSVSGVAGFIVPGDYIDLIVNTTVDEINVSRYQVENLLVLRLGNNVTAEGQGAVYQSMTIAATPEQILKINHGINNGRVTYVLRSVEDRVEDNIEPYHERLNDGITATETIMPAQTETTPEPASETSEEMNEVDMEESQTEEGTVING
jgi:pilus assembly protein CpaB